MEHPSPILPSSTSDRAYRYQTRVIRTAKLRTSGAKPRAVSMTLASTHPAALAVHSGSVTETPRPECAGETPIPSLSTGTLIECPSVTAITGPNSNDPVFLRWRLATSSASAWPPCNSWLKVMSAWSCPQGGGEPISHRAKIAARAGSCAGVQATCRHLDPRQLNVSKAAERVIEALDQRRQRHRWLAGALASPET